MKLERSPADAIRDTLHCIVALSAAVVLVSDTPQLPVPEKPRFDLELTDARPQTLLIGAGQAAVRSVIELPDLDGLRISHTARCGQRDPLLPSPTIFGAAFARIGEQP